MTAKVATTYTLSSMEGHRQVERLLRSTGLTLPQSSMYQLKLQIPTLIARLTMVDHPQTQISIISQPHTVTPRAAVPMPTVWVLHSTEHLCQHRQK